MQGLERRCGKGETVVFCNLHPRLWRKDEKSLIFVVPPASLEELWTMSQTLPKYKVRHAISSTAACCNASSNKT